LTGGQHRRQTTTGQDSAELEIPPTREGYATASLACNRPLVDGNKRLAWLATYVFLAKNEVVLDPGDDEAYDLVLAVAAGTVDEVSDIAAVLASFLD
jgi:death on curing protein